MNRVIAVDLDEVLGQFVYGLCQFHNAKYGTSLEVSDFFSYTFREVWGGNNKEATEKVHDFFKTNYFKELKVVRGSLEGVKKLKDLGYQLVVVTSRQLCIEEDTKEWIDRHFEGMFDKVVFGNHWGFEGRKRTKSELCKEVGATVLIDDSLSYTSEVASIGIKALLFDLDGKYRWNQVNLEAGQDTLPAGVTRVFNWEEVVEDLKYE